MFWHHALARRRTVPSGRTVWKVAAAAVALISIAVETAQGQSLTIANGMVVTVPPNISGANVLSVGSNGTMGTLNITPDGTVHFNQIFIGGITGFQAGTGLVNITGPNANLIANALIMVGGGTGTLNIQNGGTATSGGSVAIGTAGSGAVLVSGPNSSLISSNLIVGAAAAASQGTLTINNGAVVTTTGTTNVAVLMGSTGTINIESGGTLQTETLHAGLGSAQVNFNGGVLTALESNALFISNFAGTALNIQSGGITINTSGFNIGTDTTSAFTGVGGLTKIGTGTLTLDALNTYTGQTTVAAGTLAAGGVDVFSPNSNTVVTSGGTLALQGHDQVLNSGLVNAGVVQLGVPGITPPSTTLTVGGGYASFNGALRLNIGGSTSDKLVLNGGPVTGTTTVHFTEVTPINPTTGNGIQFIEALNGAMTVAGQFSLGRSELRDSSGEELLIFRGGLNGSNPDSFFVRSDFIAPQPPIPEPGPFLPPPPPGELPASPAIGQLIPGEAYPNVGPEVATYGVVQPIAREMGLSTLGTLHDRLGDPDGSCGSVAVTTCCSATVDVKTTSGARETGTTVATQQTTVTPTGNCNQPVAWGRVIGQTVDNRYQAYADPQATGQIVGFETGFDLWRGSLIPGHTDAAGVYFAYANAGIDVNGLVTNPAATAYEMTRTGTVGLTGYSGGAYWTHYGPSGWYVDAVIQGTGYEGSASTQFANLPLDGSGFVASLEAGYPFPFPWLGPHFLLEPQGQIIWQEVSFRGANDGLGQVDLGTTSGFTGRLGLRGKWTFMSTDGTVWQPYLQGNIWRDWGAEAGTSFGGPPVPLIEQATRLEALGGVTARLNTRWSVHAQAGYQLATDESGPNPFRRDGFQGSAGFKYTW